MFDKLNPFKNKQETNSVQEKIAHEKSKLRTSLETLLSEDELDYEEIARDSRDQMERAPIRFVGFNGALFASGLALILSGDGVAMTGGAILAAASGSNLSEGVTPKLKEWWEKKQG